MWTIPCRVGDQPHPTGASRLARAGSSIPSASETTEIAASSGSRLSVCGTLLVGDQQARVQRALHYSARRVTVTRKRSPASGGESKCSRFRLIN